MFPDQWNSKNSLTDFILALLVIVCLKTSILVKSLFTEKKQELTKENSKHVSKAREKLVKVKNL